MNKVELLGRFTKDPEVRSSQGTNGELSSIARFTLAVDRRRKSADGQNEADFISCVAFGKTAETIGKYFQKGRQILIEGRIQTGSYTKENQKIYTTDIVVEEFDFVDKAPAQGQALQQKPQTAQNPNPYAGFSPEFQNYGGQYGR